MPKKGKKFNFKDKKGVSNETKKEEKNSSTVQLETIGPFLGFDLLISLHTLLYTPGVDYTVQLCSFTGVKFFSCTVVQSCSCTAV